MESIFFAGENEVPMESPQEPERHRVDVSVLGPAPRAMGRVLYTDSDPGGSVYASWTLDESRLGCNLQMGLELGWVIIFELTNVTNILKRY